MDWFDLYRKNAKGIRIQKTKNNWDTTKKAKEITAWYVREDPGEHGEGVVIVAAFTKDKDKRVEIIIPTETLKRLLSLIPGEAVVLAEAPDHGLVRTE